MGRYGWGSGSFPGEGDWERRGGGRNRQYGRDFGDGRYDRQSRFSGESRYGRDFDSPRISGSGSGYDRFDVPHGVAMDHDEHLRASVRHKLFEDTWLDARNIQVEAEDGVIYLTGTVTTHLESRYAWDDAWETQGVRGVVTRLEVEGTGGNDTTLPAE